MLYLLDLNKLRTGSQVISILQEMYYRFADRRDARKYHAAKEAEDKAAKEAEMAAKANKEAKKDEGFCGREGCQREPLKKRPKKPPATTVPSKGVPRQDKGRKE